MDRLPGAYASFGVRLRTLRRSRGMSMRALTGAIGLSAHSNLADYECGRRIPPQDVVQACERALGVGDGELSRLRAAALAERSTTTVQPADADPDGPVPATKRRTRVVQVAAMVAMLAGLVGWLGAQAGGQPARRASASMGVSSCDSTARILDTVAVVARLEPDRALVTVGTVSLRYSPSCDLAWTRFLPAASMPANLGSVELSVHRVVDGALTLLRLPQLVGAESDPLLTVPGCVYAEVTVTFVDGSTATARTSCRTG